MNKPRQYSLVKFTKDAHQHIYPFQQNDIYIFFGEIPNMPGHCIICGHENGIIYSGYHIENFVEIDEEET